MIEKRILLQTKSNDGNIFLFNLDSSSQSKYLSKTASTYHPEIADYIRLASPIEGKLQVLITALGASEFYGHNKNKDAFPENSLKHEGTDYGYKTFETNARVFKHHINKPDSPSYGEVHLSVWNDEMKRVELILIICREKAPDIASRIDKGEFLDLSMGCHVPYDVCSICGNKARTKKDYCDHIKYYAGKIPPGYTKIASMINTLPKFFDISFVTVGADSTAKVMKKIAGYEDNGDRSDHLSGSEQNNTGLKKQIPSNFNGNLVKAICSVSPYLIEREKRIPSSILQKVNELDLESGVEKLSKILSSFLSLGIVPHPDEFQEICLRSMGENDLASEMLQKNICFDPFQSYDLRIVEELSKHIKIDPSITSDRTINLLVPFVRDRSFALPILRNRLIDLKNCPEHKIEKKIIFIKHAVSPLIPATVVGVGTAYHVLQKLLNTDLIAKLNHFALRNPAIAFAVGVGALMGIQSIRDRVFKSDDNRNIEYRNKSPLSFENYLETYQPSNLKTAGLAKRVFLGIPAAYMAAGFQEARRNSDPYSEESNIGKFVRENPLLISAGIVGEHIAGSPISKRMKKPIEIFSSGVKSGIDLLKKRADYSNWVDLDELSKETENLTIMLSSEFNSIGDNNASNY